MDIEQIKKQLAEAAEGGYTKVEQSVMAAVEVCDGETLIDNARRLVAAADARAMLTGPISDELAAQINMYDDPYPLLCDRLYMARDDYRSSYFQALEDEIDGVIDIESELMDSPELFGEGSAGQITGQSM